MTQNTPSPPPGAHDEYADAQVQRHLAEDDDIAELGIDILRRDDVIVLRGEVETAARRDAIGRQVATHYPGRTVRNEIHVIQVHCPAEAEVLS
jgi:hypothetical protein